MAFGFNSKLRESNSVRRERSLVDVLKKSSSFSQEKYSNDKYQLSPREGGIVRGPGTGISDSIPRDMRKGSFIMPADSTAFFGVQELSRLGRQVPGMGNHADYQLTPEQVYTVGWNVLDSMRNSTHTPAVLQAMLARHRNGRPGFDDGPQVNPLQSSAQGSGSTVPTAGGNPGLGTNTINLGSQRQEGSYASGKQAFMTPGEGSDAVRNGNNYWGGNVSGSVTINGQAPSNGTFSSVPGGSGATPPGQPSYASAPAIAVPSGGSGGSISNPANGSAASQALAAASRAYAGSPNGQLTANQLRTLQGLASNDVQERNAQMANATAQNNAALQAGTEIARLNATNQQFQQGLAANAQMRNYQNR